MDNCVECEVIADFWFLEILDVDFYDLPCIFCRYIMIWWQKNIKNLNEQRNLYYFLERIEKYTQPTYTYTSRIQNRVLEAERLFKKLLKVFFFSEKNMAIDFLKLMVGRYYKIDVVIYYIYD